MQLTDLNDLNIYVGKKVENPKKSFKRKPINQLALSP